MKVHFGLAVVAALMLFGSSGAKAGAYPWCAEFTRGNGTDCAYETLQQCLATVSGVGGMCRLNSWYLAAPPHPARRKR